MYREGTSKELLQVKQICIQFVTLQSLRNGANKNVFQWVRDQAVEGLDDLTAGWDDKLLQ